VLPAHSSPTTYGAPLGGLAPGTTYHFRLVAQDPDGTLYGPDQQFTTAPASSPTPPSPSPSNQFTVGNVIVHSNGTLALPVRTPGAGRITGIATFAVRQTVIAHKRGKRVVRHVTTTLTYGVATANSTGNGTFKLVIELSARAAQELTRLGGRQVTIAVTFTPKGGSARHKTKTVTVKRNRKGKYS
jgi:hypothetical protein